LSLSDNPFLPSAHPSGCPDIDEATIDPTTLMPTEGWTPIFTLDVEPGAVRNFTCNPDLTLSDIVTGRLNFTVTTPPFDWFGSAYNDGISSLPRFDVNDRVTGEFLGTYWMDTGRANYPSPLGPETFSWARWRTFMIRGNVPWSAVVTRTNTEGGGPPETCTTPGEAVISVPFTAQYTFWTC
jgi:Protein of unknown function (DUF3455)